MPVSLADLQQLLDEKPFLRMYDFKLHSVGDGEATIVVPYTKANERPGGVVAGPVYMAAADATVWFAIITKIGLPEGIMTVTTELTTSFLSGAKGEDVYCNAKVLKVGRRLVYGVAECVTPSGKLCTHHTVTYIRPGDGFEK